MRERSDIDLNRVWTGVAAEVWRRPPGRIERTAARLLRSPGLARALLTTPSLLLPWLIASVVVIGAGALAQAGAGQPLVWLIAPAVAAVGIAYAYGPGIDPAWELSCSCAVSDRLVLLTRAVAVFAVNAGLGLAASAATIGTAAAAGTAAITFAWLLPMTAICGLTLAVAVITRSAGAGAGGGRGRLAHPRARVEHRRVRLGRIRRGFRPRRCADRRDHRPEPLPPLPAGRGLLRRDRDLRHPSAKEHAVNIELAGITRRFGRNQAVNGVTLSAGPGVLGLLGPNGAGKTSLLRILATVLPPSAGTIRLLGEDPGKPAARREIRRRLGYLPQNLGYYPSFTVAEFVEYFALLKEMPVNQVPTAVAAAIERVDLGPKARARLRTLSGGMLRRVGIAQAIVNDPELLLFDEPTAGLDPEQRVAFRELMRDLGQRATVVVSTHLVEDVGAACSQVALMAEGKVVFRGTPGELTASGAGHEAGDSPLERGYSAILATARKRVAA